MQNRSLPHTKTKIINSQPAFEKFDGVIASSMVQAPCIIRRYNEGDL
jgi:hypothetical protein